MWTGVRVRQTARCKQLRHNLVAHNLPGNQLTNKHNSLNHHLLLGHLLLAPPCSPHREATRKALFPGNPGNHRCRLHIPDLQLFLQMEFRHFPHHRCNRRLSLIIPLPKPMREAFARPRAVMRLSSSRPGIVSSLMPSSGQVQRWFGKWSAINGRSAFWGPSTTSPLL